jgi:hypothetical protein
MVLMLINGFLGGMFFFLSVVLHELGHILSYQFLTGKTGSIKRKGFDIEFSFDEKSLSKSEILLVYFGGIFLGLFPLLAIYDLFGKLFFYFVLFVYFIGCNHDFKEVLRLI